MSIEILSALERRVLWLATWTIHNANHLRADDGLKVGGHQASSASMATIMTALYFAVLRPQDRVAVKPHASPIFHAIQYLLGSQTLDNLQNFRGFKGAQSYPSRTKDIDDVDFSTGSVGLGVAQTLFAALVQDYLRAKGLGTDRPEGRMIALLGDAEMDEGNIFEALLEGWKHGLRNTWWVVDYNRQSLDAVVREGLWSKFEGIFRNFGWDVVVLRHGQMQQAAFAEPGGERLREWIEACPNQLYSALTFQGGAAWRRRLNDDLGDQGAVSRLIGNRDDDDIAALMGNLGGHDLPSLLEAIERCLERVPFVQQGPRRYRTEAVPVPDVLNVPEQATMSTQQGFGLIMNEIGKSDSEFARRIVTTSPDVTVSTNLGAWVNRRALFAREEMVDLFKKERIPSTYNWTFSPGGQHLELGIAEMNLFTMLSALGLSHSLFGERLLPVGTLYDPFIERGLDALNYACYQDARFIVVGTPSGVALAPEGGAHQSIATPLIGMAQDGLASFEPAFVDELAIILRWAFDYMQRDSAAEHDETTWLRDEVGGSVYLRLSTRTLEQPQRERSPALADDIINGSYWMRRPGPNAQVVVAYTGAVASEAIEAVGLVGEDRRDVGLLAVTSADRLNAGWTAAQRARERGLVHAKSHVERLLADLPAHCAIVSVIDGHPATLAWLGAVYGHRTRSLGVEHFGQTGTIADLYRHFGIDAQGIAKAVQAIAPGKPIRHVRAV